MDECVASSPTFEEWPGDGLERVSLCPVCNRSDRRLLYGDLTDNTFFCAPGVWTMFQCTGCRTAYLDPRPTIGTIGNAYHTYFTHFQNEECLKGLRRLRRSLANGYLNRRYRTRERPSLSLGYWMLMLMPWQRAVADALMRHLPPAPQGGFLLDIGCGSGEFLARAQRARWRVMGIDTDAKAVELARAKGLSVKCGEVDQLVEMNGRFDGIVLSHVIEHLHDPKGMLVSCFNLLKPGGWLWIETPNIDSPSRARFGLAWRGLEAPRHLAIFSVPSLESLLLQAGFYQIEHMPFRNLCPGMHAASEAVARRAPDVPIKIPLSTRMACWSVSFRARLSPSFREFINIRAKRPANVLADGSAIGGEAA